jgi:hypothetical protein
MNSYRPDSGSENKHKNPLSEKPGADMGDLFHEVGETPSLSDVHQVTDERELGRHRLVKAEEEGCKEKAHLDKVGVTKHLMPEAEPPGKRFESIPGFEEELVVHLHPTHNLHMGTIGKLKFHDLGR